eukprot:2825600-Rhodomonas_salina.1
MLVSERELGVEEDRIMKANGFALPERPHPDRWRLQVPSKECSFVAAVGICRVFDVWMFPGQLADDVASEGMEVAMEQRTEAVSIKERPRRCVALGRP